MKTYWQTHTRFLIFYTITITAFIFYYYYCCNGQLICVTLAQIFSSEVPWFKHAKQNITKSHKNNFLDDWLRIHRARTNWRATLRPCSDQMAWGTLKSGWGKMNRSSAKTSYIRYLDIQPSAGYFSRIFIQTRTASGQEKTIGGDFWRVFFTGPANVAATVFDHQNGTYEAIALLVETGTYKVRAYLDYSLCDGLRDPPEDWFRVGNAQGRHQPKGRLGVVDHYLYELLQATENLTLEILSSKSRAEISDLSSVNCTNTCRALWDGHGRWKDNIWLPYLSAQSRQRQNISKPQTPRRGALWIFGDSVGVRFHGSLSKKPLCRNIAASCRRSNNWVYPNDVVKRSSTDNFDFRPNIILDSVRNVLRGSLMQSAHSVLVLNLGLHYAPSINFTTYQKLIDDIIVILHNRKKELGSSARVIWKTTTSIRKEKENPRNMASWRFLTEPRVRLFNAYAMSAMCKAGFEVLDVFPLTTSYMPGPYDVVHYGNGVFNEAENELEEYVKAGSNYNSTSVCTT